MSGEPARIVPLTAADLAGALRLSQSAHWNQNEADWRGMLAMGQGWAIHAAGAGGQRELAASTVTLPYGEGFAWVSMVLVLPEFRRRGYASALLRHALAQLAARGMAAVLDGTPAGHAVYRQEGFQDTWGFARYFRPLPLAGEGRGRSGGFEPHAASPPSDSGLQAGMRTASEGLYGAPGHAPALTPALSQREREQNRKTFMLSAAPAAAPGPATRPLRDSDWPSIAALDAPAFGADRTPLLRRLAARLPGAARVVEQHGRLSGFIFGRDGREACQIGPLLAHDDAVAQSLIGDALASLPGPVYVDLLDRRKTLLPWLEQQGFEFQRPFTRMVHGTPSAPGDNAAIVLVAGPELG
jgi:GNAT superfamily N-acetyltransferase